MNLTAYQDQLETDLIDGLQKYESEPVSLIPGRYDRWLNASALHKAVRRGQNALALSAAMMLLEHDADYFWRRIVIIALEEVGIADPSLVGQVLYVSGKAAWRQRHGGGGRVADYLITGLCGSLKDRNAAELPQTAYLRMKQRPGVLSPSVMPAEELKLIATDATKSSYDRIMALWLLSSDSINDDMEFQLRPAQRPAFQDLLETMGIPENMRMLFDHASRKTSECLSIGLIGAYLHSAGKQTSAASEELLGREMIGRYPACTYDKFTRSGRRALSQFATLPAFVPHLKDVNDKVRAVGLAVFDRESQRVSQRLTYEGWHEPMELSSHWWLRSLGMGRDHASPFLKTVELNLLELNRFRNFVIYPNLE